MQVPMFSDSTLPKLNSMNEPIFTENIEQNRRFDSRVIGKTQVFVIQHGKRIPCTTINLSANGVAMITKEQLGFRPGIMCELAFVLNFGKVIKLHHRKAKVVHVTNGVTGFVMEEYRGKI